MLYNGIEIHDKLFNVPVFFGFFLCFLSSVDFLWDYELLVVARIVDNTLLRTFWRHFKSLELELESFQSEVLCIG